MRLAAVTFMHPEHGKVYRLIRLRWFRDSEVLAESREPRDIEWSVRSIVQALGYEIEDQKP